MKYSIFLQFSICIPIYTPICSQLIDFIFNRDINFLHTNVLQQQLYNRFKKVYKTNPCNVLLPTVKKIQTCCVIIFNKFRCMIFNQLKQTSKFLKFLSLIEVLDPKELVKLYHFSKCLIQHCKHKSFTFRDISFNVIDITYY